MRTTNQGSPELAGVLTVFERHPSVLDRVVIAGSGLHEWGSVCRGVVKDGRRRVGGGVSLGARDHKLFLRMKGYPEALIRGLMRRGLAAPTTNNRTVTIGSMHASNPN